MFNPKIVAMVLAGGEGKRLYPLTRDRTKPAVPFGSRYRVIDFVLSNLINSRIYSIYLLVQYKSQSLIEHIHRSWVSSPLFPELHPDAVAVFGADHIYRMDIRQMVRFHVESGADVTVAALPVPIATAREFGVIDADAQGRIRGFHEKPSTPPTMATDPSHSYASMGNYLFNTEVLFAALEEGNRRGEKDFGKHLLPRLVSTHRLFAYDFSRNRIPGVRDYEEHNYWRDVGTIDAYYNAHQDLLGLEPRFNLFNPSWRIGSGEYSGPSVKIFNAEVDDSIIGNGTFIKGARITRSVIGCEVLIEDGAQIEECILLDYTIIRRGARLKRLIVDRHNVAESGCCIGFAPPAEVHDHFMTDSGIVVISRESSDIRSGRYL